MVKVKIIEAKNEVQEKYVGGTYEAFVMIDEESKAMEYAVHVSPERIVGFDPEQCILIDENKPVNVTEKILMVEDGSVDIDALEEYCDDKGIYVLVYRQGASKPEFLQ